MEKSPKKKDGRGGSRPNSGRPKTGKVYIWFRVPEAVAEVIKQDRQRFAELIIREASRVEAGK